MGVWASPDRPVTAQPALPTGDVVDAGNQVTLDRGGPEAAPGPDDQLLHGRGGSPAAAAAAGDRDAPDRRCWPSRTASRCPTVTRRGGRAHVRPDPAVRGAAGAPWTAARCANGRRAATSRGPATATTSPRRRCSASSPTGWRSTTRTTRRSPSRTRPRRRGVPAARAPRVVGYLTGGTRVASRLGGTTVSDRALKRRTAPTTASVHTRLGRSLPVRLGVDTLPGDKVGRTFTPRSLPFTAAAGYGPLVRPRRGPGRDPGRRAVRAGRRGPEGRPGRAPGRAWPPRPTSGAPRAGLRRRRRAARPGPRRRRRRPSPGARPRRPGPADLPARRRAGAAGRGRRPAPRTIPAGSELVVVQADGTLDDARRAGRVAHPLPGRRGRLRHRDRARLRARRRGGRAHRPASAGPRPATWCAAPDAVTTRFARPVTCVALVVETDDPDRVGELGLELHGATRATGPGRRARRAGPDRQRHPVDRGLPGGARSRTPTGVARALRGRHRLAGHRRARLGRAAGRGGRRAAAVRRRRLRRAAAGGRRGRLPAGVAARTTEEVAVTVGSGQFQLYSRIEPPLKAGDYRFRSRAAPQRDRPPRRASSPSTRSTPTSGSGRRSTPCRPTRCSPRSRRPAARARSAPGCRRS